MMDTHNKLNHALSLILCIVLFSLVIFCQPSHAIPAISTQSQINTTQRVDDAIASVWEASKNLDAILGLERLIVQSDGKSEFSSMPREDVWKSAKYLEEKLQTEINSLISLRSEATPLQGHDIDGMLWHTYGRLEAFEARFTAFQEGLGRVVSCDGFFDCIGFKADCVKLGGSHEDVGACVETCTIEDP